MATEAGEPEGFLFNIIDSKSSSTGNARTGADWFSDARGRLVLIPVNFNLEPVDIAAALSVQYLERIDELEAQLAEAEEDRAQFHCPYCDTPPRTHRTPRLPEHHCIVTYESFDCGYVTGDGFKEHPCPYGPNWPTLDDFTFEAIPQDKLWTCYPMPKTDRARRVNVERSVGRTKAEAEEYARKRGRAAQEERTPRPHPHVRQVLEQQSRRREIISGIEHQGSSGRRRPKLFNSSVPVSAVDVKALREFLESQHVRDEKLLQGLLERHPALIGPLGFVEFISEVPIFKRDRRNAPDLSDLRRRDRADIIAATGSPICPVYKAANLIELKAAGISIAERDVGFRLATEAASAVQQLREYRDWITRIPENLALLEEFDWDVRCPGLFLIMGRDHEFAGNPGQLEEVRARLRDDGVQLFTVDAVLREAMKYADQRIIPEFFFNWQTAHAAQDVDTGAQELVLVVGSIDPDDITREKLRSMSPREFEEFVADLWSRFGYEVMLTPRTRDGGVDIIASTQVNGMGTIRTIIECKQYGPGRKVGVEILRSLYGVAESERVSKGILATTSTITRDARSFLEHTRERLQVFDLEDLIDLVKKSSGSNEPPRQ